MPITCREILAAAFATLAATAPAHSQVAQVAVQAASPSPGQAPAAPAATPATPPPATWMSTLSFGAQAEGGIVLNPQRPTDNNNFGQLLTDKANQFQLNQVLLTVQRPTDPKATGYDIGFKLQGLYGSDARYTQFLGEFNHATDDRYQFDIVEADVQLHLPWLSAGGIDAKIGQYPSPLGFEAIDPSGNPFYTHSYIFNFGVPFGHTGGLAIWHATPSLDIYGGIDSGENTTVGNGDNNGAAGGIAGFGLNLLGGNLTLLALTHLGPENPTRTVPDANSAFRYENDVVLTWKATPKLSLTTEVNYIRDDAFHAEAYGAAQYASYALADTLTLNGRAEVYRDNNGFFVSAFPGNRDFVNSQLGLPATVISAPPTTYSEVTVGLTWKPAFAKPLGNFEMRPELRYDRSLNGTRPFSQGRDSGAFTAAMDAIVGF
jgi:hypothetical protein